MNNSRRVLAGTSAVGLLAVTAVAQAFMVPNFSGSGVSSPGYPDFWAADAKASVAENANGTFTLSISGNSASCLGDGSFANCSAAIFNFANSAYLVRNETLNITANFSSSGQLLSGSYEIDGTLTASSSPSFHTKPPAGYTWSAQTVVQDLFSTSLTGFTVDSKDEALGFVTAGFGGWANQPQFTGGSKSESLWLYSLLGSSHESGWEGGGNQHQNQAWNNFLAELKSGKGLKADAFYGIASVATVPLPAAVWLFGSGLAALGGALRRRARASS